MLYHLDLLIQELLVDEDDVLVVAVLELEVQLIPVVCH